MIERLMMWYFFNKVAGIGYLIGLGLLANEYLFLGGLFIFLASIYGILSICMTSYYEFKIWRSKK